jgi:peptidyl-prolyl cis-trans isomerase D
MLEQMRKSSQSLLIYVLFGIVIAVFIINFGPQSRGGCDGPAMSGDHYAAKVGGDVVSASDFRYGFLVLGGAQYPANAAKASRLNETVMDKLIERELLAQEAERLGYVVTDEEVEDAIADSRMIGLGYPRAIARVQKEGKFNYDAFKNFVQYELGLTPKTFVEEQKRELLAARVRELLRSGVKVSPDEVKADFQRKGEQVNLEYLRFTPRKHESSVSLTDAEVADYATKNEAKLKDLYEQKKTVYYQQVPKETRLRRILIAAKGGGDTTKAAQAAQKRAEQLAARIKGGEPFAKVAAEASDDTVSKARGGDLGWKRKGATGLDAATEEKVLSAKAGELVGPNKDGDNWTLLVSDGNREGDLTFDQVKTELAEEKLRQEKVAALTRADAEAALAQAKAPANAGKTLKELFPGQSDKDDKAAASEGAEAPRAEETGLIGRRGGRDGAIVEGIGVSNELSKAAFQLKPDAPLAGPFAVSGNYYVVRLKEHKAPDMAEFDKKKDELQREAELTKWMEVLSDWSHERCVEAKSARRITVNRDMLRYQDSAEPPPYEPCMPRRMFGG